MQPLFAGIKSRPLYTGITIDRSAARHLWLADAGGAVKLRNLLAAADAAMLDASEILLTGADAAAHAAFFNQKKPDLCRAMPSLPTLLVRLRVILEYADMGLRLYILGSEDFIGAIAAAAQTQGIDFDSLVTEQCGSLARRVQCVHCKGMIENVTTNIVPCPHCGLQLFVRDHYSRRLGAFQGVCANAEDPQDLPKTEIIYP